MLRIQSLIRMCALAMPLLLLAQCTPQATPPSAVLGQQKPPCLENGDPARTFEVTAPVAGPLCTGQCLYVCWEVQNACGPWTAVIEGWYDGVYVPISTMQTVSAIHWDSPLGEHALATATRQVILRVTVTDDQGLIGTRYVVLGPVFTPRPSEPPRDPVERD